jgi:hypothetical protein
MTNWVIVLFLVKQKDTHVFNTNNRPRPRRMMDRCACRAGRSDATKQENEKGHADSSSF